MKEKASDMVPFNMRMPESIVNELDAICERMNKKDEGKTDGE